MEEFKIKAANRSESVAVMQKIESLGYEPFNRSLPSTEGPSFFYAFKSGVYMIGASPSFFDGHPFNIKNA